MPDFESRKPRARESSKRARQLDQPERGRGGRKSLSYLVERRKQHAAAGRTLDDPADNTKKSDQLVWRKWQRFCSTIEEEPKTLLRDLKAEDVKTFFDWMEKDHRKSIKADSTLGVYWRVFKRLYVRETGRSIDESMRTDIINYKRQVSKRMGLRRLPRAKPTSLVDDLYHILVTHWRWHSVVFADEIQRLLVATGILLAGVSGCRLVSLFDTRVKIDSDEANDDRESHDKLDGDTFTERNTTRIDSMDLEHHVVLETRRRLDDIGVSDKEYDQLDCINSSTEYGIDAEPDTYLDADMDNDGYSETDSEAPRGTGTDLTCYSDDDLFGETETEAEADSDVNWDADDSGVTDDEYDTGTEETRTILWRHVAFYIIRSPVKGRPNVLVAKLTLLHTKGEDRKPRVKTFVIEHEPNPLFDLLGHLLALAIHDDVFAPNFRDVEEFYRATIPLHKRGMQLKIKKDKLDLSIFRQPERSANGYRTSARRPLKASTWSRYLLKLGQTAGLKRNLTQYAYRRGLINAINNKAPSSVRDQVADHESNAIKYYVNTEVNFDLAAAMMERPSNEAVQKEARLMSLGADRTAPTELTEEQSSRIRNHRTIIHLAQKSKALTAHIKATGYRSVNDAYGTTIYERKRKADAALNKTRTALRAKLRDNARKKHFRNADTDEFNRQFGDGLAGELPQRALPSSLPVYQVEERAMVVRLTCGSLVELPANEEHTRRLACIRIWIQLQDRQESPRRGRCTLKQKYVGPDDVPARNIGKHIPVEGKPKQCIYCLGNESKSYAERTFEYSKLNKMWNHVEKEFLQYFAQDHDVPCPHHYCKAEGFISPSVMAFKRHCVDYHKISLRP